MAVAFGDAETTGDPRKSPCVGSSSKRRFRMVRSSGTEAERTAGSKMHCRGGERWGSCWRKCGIKVGRSSSKMNVLGPG